MQAAASTCSEPAHNFCGCCLRYLWLNTALAEEALAEEALAGLPAAFEQPLILAPGALRTCDLAAGVYTPWWLRRGFAATFTCALRASEQRLGALRTEG